ncbi:MAG: hypothetical protein ACP5N2_07240 [Candidatus Nanoarchaeia archaeon]
MELKNKRELKKLSEDEIKFIKRISVPFKIQEFIDSLEYNYGPRISVVDVLRKKKADCLEAACFALYVLRQNKYESFLVDLSAVRDEDHVICVFKENGLYGAIAQSKFMGLRYRQPVYKTLRELAMSYFESYFNFLGYYSLRSYSKMPLKNLKENWILESKEIIKIENDFSDLKHIQLVPKNIKLPSASKIRFKREIVIYPKNVRVGKKYL